MWDTSGLFIGKTDRMQSAYASTRKPELNNAVSLFNCIITVDQLFMQHVSKLQIPKPANTSVYGETQRHRKTELRQCKKKKKVTRKRNINAN